MGYKTKPIRVEINESTIDQKRLDDFFDSIFDEILEEEVLKKIGERRKVPENLDI